MSTTIRVMSADDYTRVVELWRRTEGIGLNESDGEQAILAYLRRNPGMSAVAEYQDGGVIGAVLCGHDGRRGYLHHLAVEPGHRHQGIAARLVDWCFDRLREAGVPKCNILLFSDNESGAAFWSHNGWSPRSDLQVFQKVISSTEG
jgi:ribosomal protein S18 acetylase RimI-like enzyme